jgi:hypothetical protein
MYFFAFARGSWSGPLLPVGFDAKGKRLWWNYDPISCGPWEEVITWCRPQNGASLSKLWPLFFKLWRDDYWKNVMRTALWWYVSAAQQLGGSDAALILAQAGLELVAWVKLVETDKVISRVGFENLPAADKLRLFIAAMKIKMELDPSHDALYGLAKGQGWTVAPWAVTEIRNRLVHPKNREDLQGQAMAIFQAYSLAMHYFELAILFVCGYDGEYTNLRTDVGHSTIERVPWAI